MRFQVGDFVVSKVHQECRRLYPNEYRSRPTILQVVETTTQTCPGGTQYHYTCRSAVPESFSQELAHFNEIELDPAPTEPVEEKGGVLEKLANAARHIGGVEKSKEP